MSDSPVESVWRDVFVDELPFSSEVYRAVQLQRYERKRVFQQDEHVSPFIWSLITRDDECFLDTTGKFQGKGQPGALSVDGLPYH